MYFYSISPCESNVLILGFKTLLDPSITSRVGFIISLGLDLIVLLIDWIVDTALISWLLNVGLVLISSFNWVFSEGIL